MLVSINSSNGIFNVSSVESCEISGFTLGEIDLFFLFLPVSYSVGRRMILSIFGRLFLIEKSGWEPQRVAQRLTDLLTCNFSTTFPKFGFKIKHKKEKVKRLKKKKDEKIQRNRLVIAVLKVTLATPPSASALTAFPLGWMTAIQRWPPLKNHFKCFNGDWNIIWNFCLTFFFFFFFSEFQDRRRRSGAQRFRRGIAAVGYGAFAEASAVAEQLASASRNWSWCRIAASASAAFLLVCRLWSVHRSGIQQSALQPTRVSQPHVNFIDLNESTRKRWINELITRLDLTLTFNLNLIHWLLTST